MRTPFLPYRPIHLFRIAGLMAAAGIAFCAAPSWAGSIEAAEFNSPTLQRSWTYNVYLPSGYDANS